LSLFSGASLALAWATSEKLPASVFVRSFPVFDGEEITSSKESARVYAQALALEARVREGARGPCALKRFARRENCGRQGGVPGTTLALLNPKSAFQNSL
jgi:hypothetical protein